MFYSYLKFCKEHNVSHNYFCWTVHLLCVLCQESSFRKCASVEHIRLETKVININKNVEAIVTKAKLYAMKLAPRKVGGSKKGWDQKKGEDTPLSTMCGPS